MRLVGKSDLGILNQEFVGVGDLEPGGAAEDRDAADGQESGYPIGGDGKVALVGSDDFAIGHRKNNGERREVGDHRRASEAEKRRDDAGERNESQDASGDEDQLQGHDQIEAGDQEERIGVGRVQGRAKAAPDEDPVEREDRGEAEEAELLAGSGENQIGVSGGQQRGTAASRTGAYQSSRGERPDRMRDLVAAGDHVSPGRMPHVDALGDGGRKVHAVSRPEGERR